MQEKVNFAPLPDKRGPVLERCENPCVDCGGTGHILTKDSHDRTVDVECQICRGTGIKPKK